MTERIVRFMDRERRPTPYLVVDLARIEANYHALTGALPDATLYYAIKANPAPAILDLLVGLGSAFDVASPAEIDLALAAGAAPAKLSYGNTIKKPGDIAFAQHHGVDLFAFDAEAELRKIAAHAPGSRVFCRVRTSGEGAEWPLSRKFGCPPDEAVRLLILARDLGLVPYGLSFHVGSQQKNPAMWDAAVAACAALFKALREDGIELAMLNLGGGFPTAYRQAVPAPAAYGASIMAAVRRHFGNRLPDELIIEPGRGLVGDAGVIECEVVLIANRAAEVAEDDPPARAWVYLDIGMFNGLAETMGEAIQYPIHLAPAANDDTKGGQGGETMPVVLAGPTCDSVDVLYERADYRLPRALRIGDRLRIGATGAYTTTYSTTGFNGFAPLKEYYI